MSTLEDIKSAVAKLSRDEFGDFRDWFDEHRQEVWDKQIEEDAKAGRLDFLIAEANDAFKNGQCSPLEELCGESGHGEQSDCC